jgi:hypothetical protein
LPFFFSDSLLLFASHVCSPLRHHPRPHNRRREQPDDDPTTLGNTLSIDLIIAPRFADWIFLIGKTSIDHPPSSINLDRHSTSNSAFNQHQLFNLAIDQFQR